MTESMATEAEHGLSMRAITRLTGISEHLLRAWERRYGAISPSRSPGGTRYYSADDVVRLRLLKKAVESGQKISEIVTLDNFTLEKIADAPEGDSSPPVIQDLLDLINSGDGSAIGRELTSLAGIMGPLRWATDVVSPLCSAIGERWHAGELSIAKEHIATACIGRVTSALVEACKDRDNLDAEVMVFTTPPQEPHQLGIQIASLVAATYGFRIEMLGVQTPSKDLAEFAEDVGAVYVVVGMAYLASRPARNYVRRLRKELPSKIEVLIAGRSVEEWAPPKGVRVFQGFADFDARLSRLENR
jgi:DNA-binding transcriptional MerR regulator/methylmalonyl-CoA mutase cobalamin-binding subunit